MFLLLKMKAHQEEEKKGSRMQEKRKKSIEERGRYGANERCGGFEAWAISGDTQSSHRMSGIKESDQKMESVKEGALESTLEDEFPEKKASVPIGKASKL